MDEGLGLDALDDSTHHLQRHAFQALHAHAACSHVEPLPRGLPLLHEALLLGAVEVHAEQVDADVALLRRDRRKG